MSAQLIPPGPPVFHQNYAYWRGAFNSDDIARIIQLGEQQPKQQATVFNATSQELSEQVRRTEVSWIHQTPESEWLYRALSFYAADLNAKYFGFELFGFIDSLQYTVYHGAPDQPGHYTWHMDMDIKTAAPRKLSLVVQLSAPGDYEGGEFQFQGISTTQVDKTPGDVHAFPAWLMHRVAPVTAGIRRSLVCWIAGPQFR
jgi:PKHD-type hydroxylase